MYKGTAFPHPLAMLYRLGVALISIFAGCAVAAVVLWILLIPIIGEMNFFGLIRKPVLQGPVNFILLLYFAFGLPHLLVRPVAALRRSYLQAALGGIAVGLSIAAGVSLLFISLNHGSGNVLFGVFSLLFGAVTGSIAVSVFRLLANREQTAALQQLREAPVLKRVAISLLSLAAGCAVSCLLVLAGSSFFGRHGSAISWSGIFYFFLVFALTGYFLFGLPILVIGPLRQRFTQPFASAAVGGAAGVLLVELYVRTMFAGGVSVFTLQAVMFDLVCSAAAFLIGALTTYFIVRSRA